MSERRVFSGGGVRFIALSVLRYPGALVYGESMCSALRFNALANRITPLAASALGDSAKTTGAVKERLRRAKR